MQASRPGPLAIVILLLLIASPPAGLAFAPAEWQRAGWLTDFEDGAARARATGRPAVVYFDAEWCSWCQQYRRDSLRHPRVQRALARDFVAVAVDYDARPDLMRRYGGSGLPFTVILAADGSVLARFVGVMQPQDLLALLDGLLRAPAAASPPASGEVRQRVTALNRRGYARFRAAWLEHLESLYDPATASLTNRFETGVTPKRTSILVWIDLMERGLWTERGVPAARAARQRLWDPLDTGFFNFIDPSRDGYLETSKLLEINAWMAAWQAGVQEAQAQRTARLAWFWLREVLWDRAHGGFFQAQVADNAYYALTPAERRRRPAPPLDRAKRADGNAQAAWALARFARVSGEPRALDDAARTLDFLLTTMWREDRLYHLWRDGRLSTPEEPRNWFWLLAAGAELERLRPDLARQARLAAVARRAGTWLVKEMRAARPEPPDNELAGLIAYAAYRGHYPELPAAAGDWALRQLRIETETLPDELVIGLWAWEARLAGAGRRAGAP